MHNVGARARVNIVNLQPFLYPSVISFERSGGRQQLSSRP